MSTANMSAYTVKGGFNSDYCFCVIQNEQSAAPAALGPDAFTGAFGVCLFVRLDAP